MIEPKEPLREDAAALVAEEPAEDPGVAPAADAAASIPAPDDQVPVADAPAAAADAGAEEPAEPDKPRRFGPEPRELECKIEALLHTSNTPLHTSELSEHLGVSIEEAERALERLARMLQVRSTSIELQSVERFGIPAWQLGLKQPFREVVRPVGNDPIPARITETLALIALNQPVSQARLVEARGAKVYDHVRYLVDRGLVKKQRKGAGYALRTTPAFAQLVGLVDDELEIRQALAAGLRREGAPRRRGKRASTQTGSVSAAHARPGSAPPELDLDEADDELLDVAPAASAAPAAPAVDPLVKSQRLAAFLGGKDGAEKPRSLSGIHERFAPPPEPEADSDPKDPVVRALSIFEDAGSSW